MHSKQNNKDKQYEQSSPEFYDKKPSSNENLTEKTKISQKNQIFEKCIHLLKTCFDRTFLHHISDKVCLY